MKIALVAAIAENNAFGHKGGLPWKVHGELALFKKITSAHAVIMGRKTYESLPKRPLPHRHNIIISRNNLPYTEAETCTCLDSALSVARQWDEQQPEPKNTAMIIGGAEVLRLALPKADIFYRTLIYGSPEADVFFNGFDPHEWQELEILAATSEYSTKKWTRK